MSKQAYNGNPQDYEGLIQNGYQFSVGDCVRRGWEIFKKDAAQFVGFTLLFVLAQVLISFVPGDFTPTLVNLVVSPIFTAGFYLAAYRYSRDMPVEFSDFFKGTQDLGQLILASVVTGLITALGFVLLVIPGIYLAIAYMMVMPFILFGRLEFWPAMETSRKVITKQWGTFFLLALACAGIAILGFLALGVGILVAIPVIYCVYFAAFDEVVLQHGEGMDDLIDEIGDDPTQADPYTGDF